MLALNDHLTIAVHGGGDSGGGFIGGVEGLLSFIEGLTQQTPAESFGALMPGIAALQNLHPLVVHFPIALLTVFFALDLIGSLARRQDWRQIAGSLLYLGTAFAGITVLAGLAAASTVAHGGNVHEIMEHHEHLGISVLSLAALLSVWRLLSKGHIAGPANSFYLVLAAILSGLLAFTADLGGLMVYKYGVSVEAADQINRAAAQAHEHEGNDAHEHGLPAAHPEAEVDDVKHDDSHHDAAAHGGAGHHHDHHHAH